MSYEDITSKAQLDQIMGSDTPAVIDFWAPWCGPCKVMGPHFEAVAEAYADEDVAFYKLNTQDQPQLAGLFGIRSIPTVIFAQGGEIKDHSVGALDQGRLKKRVEKLLGRGGGGLLGKLFG